MNVNRRRFILLAVALVALNSFFWLAQGGFALSKAVINDLFGPRLIRAEVLVQTPTGPADYRLDRGVVVASSPGSITLRELNGEIVTIDVAPTVRVQGPRIFDVSQLRRRMRVTVLRDANGPVSLIQVER
jgi:autonomous glycyl radical cofactor GrcA